MQRAERVSGLGESLAHGLVVERGKALEHVVGYGLGRVAAVEQTCHHLGQELTAERGIAEVGAGGEAAERVYGALQVGPCLTVGCLASFDSKKVEGRNSTILHCVRRMNLEAHWGNFLLLGHYLHSPGHGALRPGRGGKTVCWMAFVMLKTTPFEVRHFRYLLVRD